MSRQLFAICLLLHCVSYKSASDCPKPTWKEDFRFSNGEGFGCLPNCSCADTPGYRDAYGFSCADWAGFNCETLYGSQDMPDAFLDDVIANCPRSCMICSCVQDCFNSSDPIVVATQQIRERLANQTLPHLTSDYSGMYPLGVFLMIVTELFGMIPEPVALREDTTAVPELFVQEWAEGKLDAWIGVLLNQWCLACQDPAILAVGAFTVLDTGVNARRGLYYSGVRYADCEKAGKDQICVPCTQADIDADRCANVSESFGFSDSHKAARARNFFPAIETFGIANESTIRRIPRTEVFQRGIELFVMEDQRVTPRYVPPQCEQPGALPCMELMSCCYQDDPGLEQLVTNSKFPYHVLSLSEKMYNVLFTRHSEGKASVFVGWEPDERITALQAQPITFPYSDGACNGDDAYGFVVGCDRPSEAFKNIASARLRRKAPEVYYLLERTFRFTLGEIQAMMRTHFRGGGTYTTHQEVACEWMRSNIDKVLSWIPSCPPGAIPYYALVGDGLFEFRCCNGTVHTIGGVVDECIPLCNLDTEIPNSRSGTCEKKCPEGSVRPRNESKPAETCEECPPGKAWTPVPDPMFTGVVSACSDCAAGRFTSNAGSLDCTVALPGYHVPTHSSNESTQCKPGTYTDFPGMSECLLCHYGFYNDQYGAEECLHCPVGKYADSFGTQVCKTCAQGNTEFRASDSIDDCLCPDGMFAELDICKQCPAAMTCPLGSDAANIDIPTHPPESPFPRVDIGYWSYKESYMSVYKCTATGDNACVGFLPESCSGGHLGFLCSECPVGKSTYDGVCEECSPWNTFGFVLITVAIFPCLATAYYTQNKRLFVNATSDLVVVSLLGMLVTMFQILAMCKNLTIPWHKSKVANALLSIAGPFGSRITVVSTNCVLGYDPAVLFIYEASSPFVLALCLIICHLLSGVFRSALQWDRDKTLNTLGIIYTIFFINLLTMCYWPISFYPHPNGKHSVREYPAVLTGSDKHWIQLLASAVVLLCSLVPFVVANVWATHHAPQLHLSAAKDHSSHGEQLPRSSTKLLDPGRIRVRFRFLFYRFDPSVWWWGNLLLFRQSLLAFAPAISSSEPHSQVIFVVVVLMTYAIWAASSRPWKSAILNFVDISSCICLSILLVTSTAFLEPSQNNEGFYVSIVLAMMCAGLVSIQVGLLSTLIEICQRATCSKPFEHCNLCCCWPMPNHETIACLWRDLCKQCADIPVDELRDMLTRMPASDFYAVFGAVTSWYALAPDVFPQPKPVPKRLVALEHSLCKDGMSTSDIINNVISAASSRKLSGVYNIPDAVMQAEGVIPEVKPVSSSDKEDPHSNEEVMESSADVLCKVISAEEQEEDEEQESQHPKVLLLI